MVHLSSNRYTIYSKRVLFIHGPVTFFEAGIVPSCFNKQILNSRVILCSFATTYKVSLDFFPNTKMFQFLGFLIRHLFLQFIRKHNHYHYRVDFSYLITSFYNILVILSQLIYTNLIQLLIYQFILLQQVLKELNFRSLWCKHKTLPAELNTSLQIIN